MISSQVLTHNLIPIYSIHTPNASAHILLNVNHTDYPDLQLSHHVSYESVMVVTYSQLVHAAPINTINEKSHFLLVLDFVWIGLFKFIS